MSLQNEIEDKRSELRWSVGQLRGTSEMIREDLLDDQKRLRNVAYAYSHSNSLIKRTNDALDKVLSQGEVQVVIYVSGTLLIIFLLVWKLWFN